MRNNRMDNIKAFLIFCVVFGHMLELCATGGTLYRGIYSFHMPVFIFISGYFARFNKKRIITGLVYPYFLFQFLYILFDALVLTKDFSAVQFQFTTPYWLMWYLLAMIFYYLLLPVMEGTDSRFLLVSACVLSLAAGFDRSVGYYLSLSRLFTFLPYFALGVTLRRVDIERLTENRVLKIAVPLLVIITLWLMHKPGLVSASALYGSYPYSAEGCSLAMRALLLVLGVNWIFFFLCYFPKRELPLLSSVGKYSLTVYLAHGFIKLYLANRGGIFVHSGYVNVGLAGLISLVIVFLFGNKYVGKILRLIFTGQGIELLSQKIRPLKNPNEK